MTKVMVYVMIRLMLSVFSPGFVFGHLQVAGPLVWLAVLAILAGALLALAQKNLKRMLTYLVVSEIGYMVGGAWLGNRTGMTGAILHIVNDALMTLCLFLAAGAISLRTGKLDLEDLRGLFRKMPFTMAALVAAALSVIGVPPTCGFFSKWYLLSGRFGSRALRVPGRPALQQPGQCRALFPDHRDRLFRTRKRASRPGVARPC